MIAIFSASGPIGIALGWVISNSNEIVEAVFLAISAGQINIFIEFMVNNLKEYFCILVEWK